MNTLPEGVEPYEDDTIDFNRYIKIIQDKIKKIDPKTLMIIILMISFIVLLISVYIYNKDITACNDHWRIQIEQCLNFRNMSFPLK